MTARAMTPRPPVPPATPPGHLFGSGPVAAPAVLRAPRADARPGRTVQGAGDAVVSTPASPAALPPLAAPHRDAHYHLERNGPFTLQHPASGWTLWLPEDKAKPAVGCAGSVMDVLVAHGLAAIDGTRRAHATAKPFPAIR